MTEQELNKACEFLNERLYPTVKVLNEDLVDVIDRWELIDEFRKAMTAKTNPTFERCLAKVNPKVRAEVRKNMDAVANCDLSKARKYSENRILAIPADVNEDGEVFYLDSDLGTADDEYNGLSGEIEMAYCNGYGQALLDTELTWRDMQKIVQIEESMIAEDIAGELHEYLSTPEAYYSEILKRFKEQ